MNTDDIHSALLQLVSNATYDHGRGWLVTDDDFRAALGVLGLSVADMTAADALFSEPAD